MEEQIINIFKESEGGILTTEICRKHGMSEDTFYKWKAKYGGMKERNTQKMSKRLLIQYTS